MKWYTQSQEIPTNHCVRTFGFGYSLDSKLLEEIAVTGNGGTFSFIPDAGMVGTIFIHAVASILSSVQGVSGAALRVHYKKKAQAWAEPPVAVTDKDRSPSSEDADEDLGASGGSRASASGALGSGSG